MAEETPISPAEQPELGTGRLLAGRYRVTRELGRGGMSIVYEAKSLKLGRRFAVKVPRCERPVSKEALRRLEREGSLGAKLESSHIARVFDCDTADDGTPFIVMEYVPGEDLRRVLKRDGIMPLRRALNLALQVCRGLAVAHAHGVVHRDLKPSNIALTPELAGHEHCTILDFGVAKWLEGGSPDTESTKTGALVGTLAYMPPEQIRGAKDLDVRADVYALGAILYECLSGERPFVADSPHALMYRILQGGPRSITSLRPDLPAEVATVLSRALATDREQRFASVEEFAKALDALAPGASAPSADAELTLQSESGAPASRAAGSRRAEGGVRWLVPAAVAAVLLGGLALLRRDAAHNGTTAPAALAVPSPSVAPVAELLAPPALSPAALGGPAAPQPTPSEKVAGEPPPSPNARAAKLAARPAPPPHQAPTGPVPANASDAPDPLAKRGYVVVSPYADRPSAASFAGE